MLASVWDIHKGKITNISGQNFMFVFIHYKGTFTDAAFFLLRLTNNNKTFLHIFQHFFWNLKFWPSLGWCTSFTIHRKEIEPNIYISAPLPCRQDPMEKDENTEIRFYHDFTNFMYCIHCTLYCSMLWARFRSQLKIVCSP